MIPRPLSRSSRNRLRPLALLWVTLLTPHGAGRTAPYASPAQPVQTWRGEWQDTKRSRTVPVKIYYARGDGPFPVIIFSHGLGGSREAYEYLGNYWAAHGYVSVHLQHVGTDTSIIRGGMQGLRNAITAQNAQARTRDVSFAIDQLHLLNHSEEWLLHGKLDLNRIGMAGHSFGANTTLLVSGQKAASATPLVDKRIKCAVVLSPTAPVVKGAGVLREMYQGIQIPTLHMTGTNDTSPVDPARSSPEDRRIPFDNISGADAYLVTFAGGDHMLFSGRRPPTRNVASDERNHWLIQQATLAFWDSYLKSEEGAIKWLRNEFPLELGPNGTVEFKAGQAPKG